MLEWQRDWAHRETYDAVMDIVKNHYVAYGIGVEYAYTRWCTARRPRNSPSTQFLSWMELTSKNSTGGVSFALLNPHVRHASIVQVACFWRQCRAKTHHAPIIGLYHRPSLQCVIQCGSYMPMATVPRYAQRNSLRLEEQRQRSNF
jgi:hypothetical protein